MHRIKLQFIKHTLLILSIVAISIIVLVEAQHTIYLNWQRFRLARVARTIQMAMATELNSLERIRPLLMSSPTDLDLFAKNPKKLIAKLDNLQRYGVSMFTIFDSNNNPVASYEKQNDKFAKLISPHFDSKNDDEFIHPGESGESKTGVLLNSEVPIMYAAFQIVEESKNSMVGTLLIGKPIGNEFTSNLSKKVGVELKLHRLGANEKDFSFNQVLESLKGIDPWTFYESQSEHLELAFAIKDNLDNTVIFISSSESGARIPHSETNIYLLFISVGAIVLVFSSGMVFFWGSYRAQKKTFLDAQQLNYQYLTLVNHMDHDVVWLDQNLKYLFVNECYAVRFGLEREDFTGRKVVLIHRSEKFAKKLSEFVENAPEQLTFIDQTAGQNIIYTLTREKHTQNILIMGNQDNNQSTIFAVA